MLNAAFANDIRQTSDNFRRLVDQFFDSASGSMLRPAVNPSREQMWSPALESTWTDNSLRLRAVVPAVGAEDLKVTLHNNQLIIEGERKLPEGWNSDSWTQLAYGKFQTAVTLPNNLDVDRMQCRLHDGVLDVEIPVTEARRPRQVRIETGEQPTQKAIHA
jgi:HSP20 family protein